MLYRETVEPHTLELLIELMQFPELADYRLVGGTALSLQYGHRRSVDLDFFGISKLPIEESKRLLKSSDHAHLSIAAIAYDSGFNSISSFNSQFKKQEGQTAKDYRAGI